MWAPFDYQFPAPLDDFDDDVLHLLDIPLLGDDVAAATPAPVQQSADDGGSQLLQPAPAYHGSTGDDDLLDWSNVDDAPPPPTLALPPVHGVASTSSAAPAPQEDTVDCSGCQVLREVVHTNGLETTKLCVHGGAGAFYHAILEVYRVKSGALALAHHALIDFRGRDYDWVKQYLTEYALRRAASGFAVVQDSLSAFHDALCTNMAGSSHVNDAHRRASSSSGSAAARTNGNFDHQLVVQTGAIQPASSSDFLVAEAAAVARTNSNGSGDRQLLVHTTAIKPPASGPSQASHTSHQVQQRFHLAARSALAMQRERTKKLQLDDIAPYFDLPIAKAASKLDVCATALKAICRKHGVLRWPYRKVRSIDRQIATLRRSGNGDATKNEIESLIASRRRIVAGL
ncbi:hypothetical protein E2562_017793 [Oryza meyeriana var. granulata]|uniref:RWP-RK domain-containing protein n=1 Tax=Oryza meyeriana var. granulata TaxID=110450 RepID=A0A6G1BM11_9ORYZ|nr:hypothetical protein E2562_017793 [Oryza meyeriana var. granulata]